MGAAVRRPAAAGSFYPSDPAELTRLVDRLLSAAIARTWQRPDVLVVPHAGYVYSGPVAANAYATIRPWADDLSRVAILGPAHFVPLHGCAVTSATAWRTPLGDVEVDDQLRGAALCGVNVGVDDLAHAGEHALEVQLPFLQRLLGPDMRFLPLAVGSSAPVDVCSVIDALEAVADLVVVSTDLSHYHDAETARRLDRRTADAILALDAEAIGVEDACGRDALRGAVEHARARGCRIELLDLRTSGDITGDRDRVVGYGAFAFTRPSSG